MKHVWRLLANLMMVVLLLAACSNESTPRREPATLADWPTYTFAEMINGKTDAIVLAHVTDVKQVSGQDVSQVVQLAELSLQETLYGKPTGDTITLYQSVDKVKLDGTYLLFLQHRPEERMYVVADANSQSLVSEGKLTLSDELEIDVKVSGIAGTHTLAELRQLIEQQQKNAGPSAK